MLPVIFCTLCQIVKVEVFPQGPHFVHTLAMLWNTNIGVSSCQNTFDSPAPSDSTRWRIHWCTIKRYHEHRVCLHRNFSSNSQHMKRPRNKLSRTCRQMRGCFFHVSILYAFYILILLYLKQWATDKFAATTQNWGLVILVTQSAGTSHQTRQQKAKACSCSGNMMPCSIQQCLADPGEARGCSTNTSVINSFII